MEAGLGAHPASDRWVSLGLAGSRCLELVPSQQNCLAGCTLYEVFLAKPRLPHQDAVQSPRSALPRCIGTAIQCWDPIEEVRKVGYGARGDHIMPVLRERPEQTPPMLRSGTSSFLIVIVR